MRRFLTRVPPVVVLLVAIVLGFVLPERATAPGDAQWAALLASSALFVAGLVIIARAAREFRRHRTSILPHAQPTHLVRSGPFGWSRNPIYVGMLLLSLVPFAWSGELVALVSPGLYFLYMDRLTIPQEEDRLRQRFPDTFEPYRQQVRRWI